MARTFETGPPGMEIEPLSVEFDEFEMFWDLDDVISHNQLWLIHDLAIEEGYGDAYLNTIADYEDYSFKPLGMPAEDNHNFIIWAMRNWAHELPLDPQFAETVDLINQAAAEENKKARHNILTSRSSLLEVSTVRHLKESHPDTFHSFHVTGNAKPEPPEFPKPHYVAKRRAELEKQGIRVAMADADDSIGNAVGMVNEGGSNMGIVYGDKPWNRGELPGLNPNLDPRQHRIVRAKDLRMLGRQVVGGFFPTAAQRLLAS